MLASAINVLLFAADMAVAFQNLLRDPANASLGDNGDGLVMVATLEHWWRALNGIAVGGSWRQAGFFYPIANPIGLTDSYLGLAIPYCVLRLCNVGPFTATTVTMGLFAAVGYWGGYAFCRASKLACRAAAMLTAWIFAFGAIPIFRAGQALMEAAVYDTDGQFVTGSYMDYALPRADNLPAFVVGSEPFPAKTNSLGVKGCGEAGCAGSLPAVINALVDALSEFGVRHVDMPATPERVWRLIRAASATA